MPTTDPNPEEKSAADAETADPTSLVKNASAETKTLPAVPSVRSPEKWEEPATPEQAADAVSAVEALVPANMKEEQVGELAQMVARRDYTAAELAYVVEEMMYDQELTKELTSFRDQPRLYPSDFDRFVEKIRELRRRLECALDRHDMNRLIRKFDELSRWDFGIMSYTPQGKPIFRFKNDPDTADGDPNPKLDEDPRPGEDRKRDEDEDQEPVQIGDVIDDQ